ncbi:PD-(D/E)XK motif protein [Vibrio splendidus]
MINIVGKIFSDLEADKNMLTNKNNTLERIILSCSDMKFFLYYSPSTSKRGLRVSLSCEKSKMKFKVDSKGFTYRYHENSLYIEEDKEYISNIFKVFVSELIPENEIGSSRLFFENFKNKILEWRDFFQDINEVKPSQELVKGLFGELCYLRHLLRSGTSNAVACWTGPLSARSDFFVDNKRLEVKSTTTKNPTKISISSSNQLRLGTSELHLILYELIENEGGCNLGCLMKEILDILDENLQAKTELYKKLEKLGCNETFVSLTEKHTYNIEDFSRYNITEEFPSLSGNKIPKGIIDVKYSILKDTINSFRVDFL